MKRYNVVFHYSVEVVAADEEEAQDQAFSMFGAADPANSDYFSCTVEEKPKHTSVCEFCLGENWSEEDPFDGHLVTLEYHYKLTGDTCAGQACRRCVDFVLNDDENVSIDYLGEKNANY